MVAMSQPTEDGRPAKKQSPFITELYNLISGGHHSYNIHLQVARIMNYEGLLLL